MKLLLAIDPGQNGGVAWWNSKGNPVVEHAPATEHDYVKLLSTIKKAATLEGYDLTAYVEKVGGFVKGAKLPGSAMFNFGYCCGVIEGALRALEVPTIYVRPQQWQKHFNFGTKGACKSKTVWKNKLKSEAQRRYPAVPVTLKTCDALLILSYAIANNQ